MAHSVCINHTDREGSYRCITCHKPICEECIVTTEQGTFCSATCEANYVKFHNQYAGEQKDGFLAKLKGWLVSLIFLLGMAAIGIYAGAKLLGISYLNDLLKRFGL